MKSYYSPNATSDKACAVALGCFDGVHAGHIELIENARKLAQEQNISCAVWSFSEPPRNFFAKNKVPLLTTTEEKSDVMQSLGVDIFVCVPFCQEISEMSAEDFFNTVLIGNMKAKHIVCGFNYKFGKNGSGNAEILRELCEKSNVSLSVIPPVTINDITVSSSEIRASLESGNIETANAFLTRPYSIRGEVINGQHLGRKLGFPTVNQVFPASKVVPSYGVYLSKIDYESDTKYGITNIGKRPTVGGDTIYAETNIFDFDGDLYGKNIKIELLQFIRPEQKFSGIEELSAQVKNDIEKSKQLLKSI